MAHAGWMPGHSPFVLTYALGGWFRLVSRHGVAMFRLHEDGGPAGTGLGRQIAVLMPIFIATAVEGNADVAWYVRLPLPVFAAWLPLLVILRLASVAVTRDGKRRARRSMRPRPKAAYLRLATGLALVGVLSGLGAWAAGARATGPEPWTATGLAWGALIGACAVIMMAGCALTAQASERSR